jgi:Tfp pilus assembly protein PilN
MIEINLLPKELQKKKRELPNVSFLPMISVLLGIIIMAHLLLILAINLNTRSLKRLEKRWQEISPDKESADKLKYELTTMRSRIDTIDDLIQNRISWAKKLNDLNDAMIPGVWLNKLWLEKKAVSQKVEGKKGEEKNEPLDTEAGARPEEIIVKTLHLNGSVIAAGGEETAAIGKFIRSLKSDQGFFADFNDIESVSIQRNRLDDVEVMDFELICYFK